MDKSDKGKKERKDVQDKSETAIVCGLLTEEHTGSMAGGHRDENVKVHFG